MNRDKNIDKDLMEVCKASQDGRLKKIFKDVARQREIDRVNKILKSCPLGDAGKPYLATHLVDNNIGTENRFEVKRQYNGHFSPLMGDEAFTIKTINYEE